MLFIIDKEGKAEEETQRKVVTSAHTPVTHLRSVPKSHSIGRRNGDAMADLTSTNVDESCIVPPQIHGFAVTLPSLVNYSTFCPD